MNDFLIKEAAGVRPDLYKIAKSIYSQIIYNLNIDQYYPVTQLANVTIPLKLGINNIKNIKVIYDLNYGDVNEIILFGLGSGVKSHIKDSRTIYSSDDTAYLHINLGCKSDMDIIDIVHFFEKNRATMISSIAHELKHFFDNTIRQSVDIKTTISYYANTALREKASIVAQTMSNAMYFTSLDELLVAPTEVYAELRAKNVTKKKFLDEINNIRLISEYKNIINNFNYNKIYDNIFEEFRVSFKTEPYLKSSIFDISKKYLKNGASNDYTLALLMTELAFHTVRIGYYDIIKTRIISLYHKIPNYEFLRNIGITLPITDPEGILLYNKMSKNEYYAESEFSLADSPRKNMIFFTREINKIRNKASKILRKLYKIYSLLPDKNPPNISGSYKK